MFQGQCRIVEQSGKVFTIQGSYPAIREALCQRGWVEQFFVPARQQKQQTCAHRGSSPHDPQSDDSDDGAADGVYGSKLM